jgi:hypothetical protein
MTSTRVVVAAALIACSSACVGRRDSHSDIPTDLGGGIPSGAKGPTTLVGCLERGDRDDAYRLLATADTPDHPRGAAATGRTTPGTGATTGIGGDAIRDAPTIGSGSTPRTYALVPDAGAGAQAAGNVGAQVSVVGVIEDAATVGEAASQGLAQAIRATSVTKIGGGCGARPH